MTPAARSRVMADAPIVAAVATEPIRIERVIVDPVRTGRDHDVAAADAWARKHCGEACETRFSPIIPARIDQNPSAHERRPMDRMRQGWSMRSFQAAQQWAMMSS